MGLISTSWKQTSVGIGTFFCSIEFNDMYIFMRGQLADLAAAAVMNFPLANPQIAGDTKEISIIINFQIESIAPNLKTPTVQNK